MSDKAESAPEVTEVSNQILRDLEAKHEGLVCPVHGERPRFEVDGEGGVVESFCCDVLLQIFRELGSSGGAIQST